jgi:polyhydroxyalkanoate synthesis regulator phasin
MTDDLVRQLRQASMTNDDYRWKAADMIERLTAELHIATEWSARVHAGQQEDADTITALRAEVERLRNELQEAVELLLYHGLISASDAEAALKENRT